MTLTVPRAGTSPARITRPGRAARPGPQVVDAAGDELAGFGQAMLRVGTSLENERLDRQMQRASLDLVKGFDALREQVHSVTDPELAADVWMRGVEDLRLGFSRPDESGRPRIDAANQERFDLNFDSMQYRHEQALGRKLLAARSVQRQAMTEDLQVEAARLHASTPDPEIQAMALEQVTADLEREVVSGRMSDVDAVAARNQWVERADVERALVEVSDDDGEAYAFELDDADAVAIDLSDDPDFARLARVVDYRPDSPGAVSQMRSRMEEFAALNPAQREEYLTRAGADRAQRLRTQLGRPRFLESETADLKGLQLAASRTVEAFQSGRIDRTTYAREADRLRQLMEAYHV